MEQEKFVTLVKKLYEDAELPVKVKENDAGADIFVHRVEDCGHFIKVFSGISIQPPLNYWYMLVPRSSAHKMGLLLYNSVGILDQSYRGEIIGLFLKTEGFTMPQKGDRLLQLIPQRQLIPLYGEVDELDETTRGTGGFGSSGT